MHLMINSLRRFGKMPTRGLAFVAACIVLDGCAPPVSKVERQMGGLIEKFDRWDYDGNGTLDRLELKQAAEISGYNASRLIKFYDTNGDGKISLSEAQQGKGRADEVPPI